MLFFVYSRAPKQSESFFFITWSNTSLSIIPEYFTTYPSLIEINNTGQRGYIAALHVVRACLWHEQINGLLVSLQNGPEKTTVLWTNSKYFAGPPIARHNGWLVNVNREHVRQAVVLICWTRSLQKIPASIGRYQGRRPVQDIHLETSFWTARDWRLREEVSLEHLKLGRLLIFTFEKNWLIEDSKIGLPC